MGWFNAPSKRHPSRRSLRNLLRKQRKLRSNIRRLKKLTDSRAFSIGASVICRYVASRFPDLKPAKEESASFEVEPGHQLQIDFVQCLFRFGGSAEATRSYIFEAIYSISRRGFILLCPDLTQKSWLTGFSRCLGCRPHLRWSPGGCSTMRHFPFIWPVKPYHVRSTSQIS